MNNENQSSEVKTQIKTSKSNSILGWFISIFFLLIGLVGFQGDATIGIIFIVIGLFFLPPINNKIKNTKVYSTIAKHLPKLELSDSQLSSKYVCTNCGSVSNSIKEKKGSGLIELILWLFFIVPGIFYSIWRRSNRKLICPKCKQPTLIPVDSPNGQKIMSNRVS